MSEQLSARYSDAAREYARKVVYHYEQGPRHHEALPQQHLNIALELTRDMPGRPEIEDAIARAQLGENATDRIVGTLRNIAGTPQPA